MPCFSAFAALIAVCLMAFQICAAVFLILFQILTKNAETCDHRPLHHCGMEEKKSINFCAAAGIVSVKNTTTLSQSSISFADTVSQSWPNHSVIAPQFFTMAMIAAMAAATPAMMPITGSSEILSAPKATESAAIIGVRAVKATSSAPRITTKFCTGSGSMPKIPLTVSMTATRGGSTTLASSTIFSPSGISACWSFLVLASISCMGVPVWLNRFCAEPATLS